jgi:hypothetical protein
MRVYEITLSREAQTLSMSEPRGGPEFKSVHSVWDRLANAAAVDGRIAQRAAIRGGRGDQVKSTLSVACQSGRCDAATRRA